MYIVGRSRHINQAKARAAAASAIEAGSRASEIIDMPVFVWASVFSADGPATTWSVRVEHLADAVALDDKLFADDGFAQWVEDNDELYVGPTSDVISQVVHGVPTGPPKGYVQITRAICANGSIGEAMGVGIEPPRPANGSPACP